MTSTDALPALETVTLERDEHVLLIGLNRPHKRNAFNQAMLTDLARAYGLLESDASVRAGVLFAHGDHFTGGLDLVDVGPNIASGDLPSPADGRDPWRLDGPWTTPLVAAAHGWCMTLGIELLLAGDEFDAAEAHRIGLVQEVVDDGSAALSRARNIAQIIAERAAPLAVQATLVSAHLAREQGDAAAIERLRPDVAALFATADAAEGVQSFIERRKAQFQGR